jgi:hypothetical protein
LSNRGQKNSEAGNISADRRSSSRHEAAPDDAEFADVPLPEGPGIPRWRQIEIMQERAQLRRMLDDLDMNFDELEAEIFGSEEEHDVFYRHFDESDDEEIELEEDGEEDDFEDDDYEDLED